MIPPSLRLRACLWATLWGAVAGTAVAQETAPTTLALVANAENQTKPRVRYSGNPWSADQGGFLLGTGRGHRLLAEVAPGTGDFRIEVELSLPAAARESIVVLGGDSELGLAAGAKTWRLRGRFFRIDEGAIEIPAPVVAAGKSFTLVIERKNDRATISTNGAIVHQGPCSGAALSALGFDPGAGSVRLYSLAVSGNFPSAVAPRSFGNPFGMQLRRAPTQTKEVREPVIVRGALTNESSVLRRRDGTLETYSVTKPASDSVTVVRSRDGGLTWSEPQVAFSLPGRAYYALQVLEAADGALHAAVHVQGDGPGGYRGRLYEVYHTKLAPQSTAWTPPVRIVPGYIGSIRGFIQLQRSGRLVLAVARAIPAREQAPSAGPDLGWNDTFVYFSDDQGNTWRESPDRLSVELKTPNATRYGAIEPVLLELRDGRVWMLVRDRQGRLLEAISADGERWPPLQRSAFISSDSPAALLRLRNGKIVLLTNACQNWTDPRSYAMGGREVLHAAISADDGKTWRGFREIFHETDSVSGGDRGTAYPALAENMDGKVVVVSGQGEGKRAIVTFDPTWLEEREVRDVLSAGPAGWTQYGDEGLRVETSKDGGRAVAIPLKATGLCGAAFNFPVAAAGELRARLQIPVGAKAVRLSLSDHFNRIDDRRAADHAVFAFEAEKLGLPADGRARDLLLRWSGADASGELRVTVDGSEKTVLRAARAAQFGVNYLRVEFRGAADQGSVLVGDLAVHLP